MRTDYDIIIVGAGMVGASLAAALNGNGYRSLLIDARQPPDLPGDTHELRVSAINVATENFFRRLGVFENIIDRRACPMRRMFVWDESGRGITEFDAAEIGEPHLGHIIENNNVTRSLVQRIEQGGDCDFKWPASLQRIAARPDGVEVQLDSGETLTARLLVGADGARSRVRELADINAEVFDYDQRTLVAIARTERAHQNCAWQRFLHTGPVALLPLADGLASLAWHADNELAAELATLSPEALGAKVSAALEHKLGKVSIVSPSGGFGLTRMHAERYVGDRIALIGDAAHAVHPLAGLGANLGFMDAASLASTLTDSERADPGEGRRLRHYERNRRLSNSAVVAVTDGFKHVFGTTAAPTASLRNLGLTAADRSGPVKHAVIRYAIGIRGDIPQLARPGPV